MTILIAPDIFGHTPALDRLVRCRQHRRDRAPETAEIKIISPYEDTIFFRNEEPAYGYFTSQSGIPAYARRIEKALGKMTMPVTLIGFSAGASAIWYLSGQGLTHPVSKAIGFYGSQIRHYPDIIPDFDVHLIFPAEEPHFDVSTLAGSLISIPGVTCETAPGGHGFMNEYSQNHDPILYKKYLTRLFLCNALGNPKIPMLVAD